VEPIDPRVYVRRSGAPDPDGRCVVYWMQRAQRAADNPALDTAIHVGNALRLPVVVFVAPVPSYPGANLRHYTFLFHGVPDIAAGLARRRVGLVYRPWPWHSLLRFLEEARPALLVGDENPLRLPEQWRERVARVVRMPFWTVDADVVVPARLLGRQHYAARTIRPRLQERLEEFLVIPTEPRARVAWGQEPRFRSAPVGDAIPAGFRLDRSVGSAPAWRGGSVAGMRALRHFVRDRLTGYAAHRNHPELDGTSRLSPYLHFGHLGPRMVARAVEEALVPEVDRRALLEELIVRRELAVNYCRYNRHYDRLAGAEPWARRTLATHSRDRRTHRYSERQLEHAETHDPLWNAAQRQMVQSGWMHGYLRMYWGKKILEWSASPSAAYAIAVRLNDRYELDGRDPNGYAGVAWAIGGKHDRAWGPERPVYGTVRYMSFESTRRKFDSRAYIARWAGV
jgi:deoxyribodipyrimidine photo-lyase